MQQGSACREVSRSALVTRPVLSTITISRKRTITCARPCGRGSQHDVRHTTSSRKQKVNSGRVRPKATSGRPSVPSGPGGGGNRLRPTGGSGEGGGGSGDHDSTPLAVVTALFAVLILVGGVMGYVKKGSTTSLAASLVFALVYLLAARFMLQPASATSGIRLAMGASVTLGGYMANGYLKTRKLFPQGAIAGLSLTLALAYISQGL